MASASYTYTVGVVIGRFQLHELHEGHLYLLDTAQEATDVLCVLLGSSGGELTKRNPLPFEVRKRMIEDRYPEAQIYEIMDSTTWSEDLDALLEEKFPTAKIRLFGSRDSFAKEYYGRKEVVIVEPKDAISGTEIRNRVHTPKDHTSFRLGMVESQKRRFSISYQTVDAAVVDRDHKKILLGRKEKRKSWCFPGGFVDATDASLEDAVLRELHEEVPGLTSYSMPKYLGSVRVQDHRYRNEEDKILTALFLMTYESGAPVAGDDLKEVAWFSFEEAKEVLQIEHLPLLERVVSALPSVIF